MSKISMACPFTHHECTECPVYRGRHFYHCFSKSIQGSEWEMVKHSYVEFRKPEGDNDKTFGMPDEIILESAVISNVEDIVENEELSRLKERREG